MYIAPISRKSH